MVDVGQLSEIEYIRIEIIHTNILYYPGNVYIMYKTTTTLT